MKKAFSVILSIIILIVAFPICGSATDMVVIKNASQLSNVRNNLSGNYILACDIDLSSLGNWTPIGNNSTPFTGTFDGNGYEVSGINVFSNQPEDIGFFGYVVGGTIKNLHISGTVVSEVGDFADELVFANAGGIAGNILNSTIEQCSFTGSVSCTVGNYCYSRAGGITTAVTSTIRNCYSNADVYAFSKAVNVMAAGICVWSDGTTIDKCYFTGNVKGETKIGYCYVGGINASGGGTISNCVVDSKNITGSTGGETAISYINTIGNFGTYLNNRTGTVSQSDCESLGWDFNTIWTSSPTIQLQRKAKGTDSDGDGLLDIWEENGLDYDGDGIIDVDLPAMGADPDVPDVFVEVDWMVRPQKKFLWWETQSSRNMAPSSGAMRLVYNSFKAHGINLHIDVGPDSIDFVTGKKWSNLSGGNEIPYEKMFDINSSWDSTVNSNFSESRYNIFKHCLFINQFDGTTSGIANDIPGQFFIVANQDWVFNGGDTSVGGTFMHELGHTLGLCHGGCDHEHYKPNYLSVMNYAFQTTGLVGTNAVSYSDYKLPDLNESIINENSGIDPSGLTAGTNLGTTLFYRNSNQRNVSPISKVAIDFNNNGTLDNNISFDLNPGGNVQDQPIAVLRGHEDWSGIVYNGGEIGKQNSFSNSYSSGIAFPINDTGLSEKTLEESLSTSTLASVGTGYVELLPSSIITDMNGQSLEFEVGNMSADKTTFTVLIQCPSLFNDFSKSVTISGSNTKIESEHIVVPITKEISLGEHTIFCSIISNDKSNDFSFTQEAVEVNKEDIEEMKQLLSEEKELTDEEVDKIESLIETYENTTTANICKFCGKDHGESFCGKLVLFFHNILYFFKNLIK